jgi:hypothetical protein
VAQRRWTDPSQPQTLQGAVIFSYVIAAFAVLSTLLYGPGPWLLLVLLGVSAFYVANERRWAYWLASGIAILYLAFQVLAWITFSRSIFGLLPVLFAGVLLGLLLHPQSRHYARIYFR